jgi:hypothetical protein
MNSVKRLPAMAALVAVGLLVTAGTATATENHSLAPTAHGGAIAASDFFPGDPDGAGSTAVNSAGDGTATQTALQPRTDTSTHTRTVTAPEIDSHTNTYSHNRSHYRDSHDQTTVTRVPAPDYPYGPL